MSVVRSFSHSPPKEVTWHNPRPPWAPLWTALDYKNSDLSKLNNNFNIAACKSLEMVAALVSIFQARNIFNKYRNYLLILPQMWCPCHFPWIEVKSQATSSFQTIVYPPLPLIAIKRRCVCNPKQTNNLVTTMVPFLFTVERVCMATRAWPPMDRNCVISRNIR